MLYDWLKHIDFAYPWVFTLFVLIPVLIFWHLKKADKNQVALVMSTTKTFTASSWKARFRILPFLLRLLAISCLIIVMARPQERNDQSKTEGEGIDIVLCMDVSGSMGSRDILPSRMEVAKQVAADFVRSRPVDRIGLVIFSGESFTQCPVTTDKSTLLTQIESLESRRYLIDGTVIGEGLATAVDRLYRAEGKSKVIILLTDGKEDPPETRLIDPLTALEIAKSKNVKVYTIGMSATPVAATTVTSIKNPMVDFLDEALLKKIATETGGQYFRAKDKASLQKIYDQIDQLEKTKVEIQSFKRYKEKFLPFMLAAMAFVFLEMLLKLTLFKKFP